MNRKDILNSIAKNLSRFKSEVEILSKDGLYDINLHSENVLIPILNNIYNLNLTNANTIKKNYPGIDLIDNANRIAFQVTSTTTITKIKHTLKEFIHSKAYQEIDVLFVFILTDKQKKYKEEGIKDILSNLFDFEPIQHIIDISNIFTKLNNTLDRKKIELVQELLSQEFSDEKIDYRKSVAEDQEKVVTEKIYANLVKLSLPDILFIADLNLDRDEVISKSWETDDRLKKNASDRKVLIRALQFSQKEIDGNWQIFGKKIISFKDFHAQGSTLTPFVVAGTTEEMPTSEFSELDEKYRIALSQLINANIRHQLFKKHIKWIKKENIFRFSPDKKLVGVRKIEWKNLKRAIRKVIDENWNQDKTQIISYKHLAFKTDLHLLDCTWYLSISPTWSYTWNGYSKSKLESKLLSGIKRLENNKSIYLSFLFIVFCLRNNLPNEIETEKIIDFSESVFDNIVYNP